MNLLETIEMTKKIIDCRDACKIIYWNEWDSKRIELMDVLVKHHKTNKTKWLLSSAIEILKNNPDEKLALAIIGTCAYINNLQK